MQITFHCRGHHYLEYPSCKRWTVRTEHQGSGDKRSSTPVFGQEALGVIRAQGGQALARGAEEKLEQLNQGIERTTGRLKWASKVAGEQALTLSRAQTTMVWKSLFVLASGAVLALGGAGAWAWTKKQEADRYRIDVELGRIVSSADVIKCGDGLCANVEIKGQALRRR